MISSKKENSVERFIHSQSYNRASQSENPNEKCKNCSMLFLFRAKTHCYAYEQQTLKDKDLEFNPRRDFNCTFYDTTDFCANSIEAFIEALKRGNDPQKDDAYLQVLKNENEAYAELQKKGKNRQKNKIEEWDDPNSYANCSDWEDEPDNCFSCADDECPMNKS